MVLGQLPPRKIASHLNSKTTPNSNPNPNPMEGPIFLEDNCWDAYKNYLLRL